MLDIVKPNHHLFLREAANAMGGIFKMRILWMQVVLELVPVSCLTYLSYQTLFTDAPSPLVVQEEICNG